MVSSSKDKNWNSVPGIRNPQREIQNPRLSWISLYGVLLNTLKCILPTSFRVALVCNYPALCSPYACRVGLKTIRTLICVVDFAYQCYSLVNKQRKMQKNSNLQELQLRQIGKYPTRKLFNFVVVQVPARISLIILTAYFLTRMFSETQPYPSLFYYYRCCLLLQY